MKVAFITPDKISKKFIDIIKSEFEEIMLTVYEYNKYEDVIEILKCNESKHDAIIFVGFIPYYICIKNINRTKPWYYTEFKESWLKGGLLKAITSGFKINNISFDGQRATVENTYNELEINYENIYVKYDDIRLEDFDISHELINETIEDMYIFHKDLYEKKKVDYCLTSTNEVHKKLTKDNIPNGFVTICNDSIREVLTKVYLKHIAMKNENSHIVALAINIDMPKEYSIDRNEEFSLILEKEKIEQEIYKFAHKIKAAVTQMNTFGYLLFSTKEVLELETEYYTKIDLIRNIDKISNRSISMGIGYGDSGLNSKYNAFNGLEKAQNCKHNSTYIVYEDGTVNGPIYSKPADNSNDKNIVEDKLLKIALKSHLSINTIWSLYEIVTKQKKDTFTSKELGQLYGISNRGINRILLRLEDAGYIEVVGSSQGPSLGRPSRIIRLKFNS